MICGREASPTITRSSRPEKLSAMCGSFSIATTLCPSRWSPRAASDPNRPSPMTRPSSWYKRILAMNSPWGRAGSTQTAAQATCRYRSIMPTQTRVVWDQSFTNYDFGADHPMNPVRLDLTARLCGAFGLFDGSEVEVINPVMPGDDVLLTVRDVFRVVDGEQDIVPRHHRVDD